LRKTYVLANPQTPALPVAQSKSQQGISITVR
jgi:hypothetical protein